jgi:hypothetical protein
MQDRDRRGNGPDQVHIVLDHDHRPLPGQFPDQADHPDRFIGRHSARRLIQKDEGGVGRQSQRHFQRPLRPVRELSGLLVRQTQDFNLFQDFLRLTDGLGIGTEIAKKIEMPPQVDMGRQADVFQNGQVLK